MYQAGLKLIYKSHLLLLGLGVCTATPGLLWPFLQECLRSDVIILFLFQHWVWVGGERANDVSFFL